MITRTSNESIIYNFLVQTLGFSPAGAAGALGNLEVESGFSPSASNPREGAIGIAQWEGGRRTALDAYASRTGGSETNLMTQLGYLAQELKAGYSGVLADMRAATDPAAAAADWDAHYEGSAGTTRTQRVGDAQTIYQQVRTGAVLTGGGSASFSAGPPPPINHILSGPLNPSDRTLIINWLVTAKGQSRAALTKMTDQQLEKVYNNAFPGTGSVIGGLASATEDAGQHIVAGAFQWVVTLATKSLFTIGGVGLAVLGLYAAAHSAGGS